KEALAKRLARKHKFEVNGEKYCIYLRLDDVRVLPQVMGLFISRLELDRGLQHQKVAVIDVGTYTSDWTIVEACKTLHWASGGAAIGLGNVIEGVRAYLREEHRNHCSYAVASEAVRQRRIRSGGRIIDLSDHIDQIVFKESETLLAALAKSWGDAKDSQIIIGGGGCRVYAPAIRSQMAHAKVIEDENPVFSIVDGYHLYMSNARKQLRRNGEAA
ncbi:ParM/StbA family protein, partial [Arthrospira platensis SPKY2]